MQTLILNQPFAERVMSRFFRRPIALPLSLLFIFVVPALAAENDASVSRLRKDLEFLASDACEGRGAQTEGIHKAAAYIAAEFQQLGLKPGGTNGSYFQPFTMRTGRATIGVTNRLVVQGSLGQAMELKLDAHFRPLGLSAVGKASAPLVFVGYGLSDKQLKYDDYSGIDAAGKIVVVLRKTPPVDGNGGAFGGGRANQLGSLSSKLLTAQQHKAAGVIFVNDRDTAKAGDPLMPFEYTAQEEPGVDIPSVQIQRSQLDAMLQSSAGKGLNEIEREIERTASPHSVALNGWSASFEVQITRKSVEVKNVIGIMDGRGPLANEIVVIGAHYDHLGRGERGSLERDAKKRETIHHGADDNGSGSVSVMELARRFALRKTYEGRTIVFMTFAGEEQGLLGSRYFCNHPTVPLDKACAMVNLDMVGRLRTDKDSNQGKLEIGGIGSAKNFTGMIDELNKKYDFKLARTISAYGPSDHTSFAEKKVPVFFLFTGLHGEYHRPADVVATINFEGMKKIVDFTEELVDRLTAMKERPEFVQTPRGNPGGIRAGVPTIGIMPGNYDEASEKGVLIGGVTDGRPAAKAGMKEGDFIVEIAGKPIKNMSSYMTVMSGQKKGEPVEMIVERGGKKIKLTVKPE
jgi:Peptidase family M28/PDZ domain/PA domain